MNTLFCFDFDPLPPLVSLSLYPPSLKKRKKRRCNAVGRRPHWGSAEAEIKVPSVENTELKGSPFKVRRGQYVAIYATLTARDFFLANFYPSGPFAFIFFKSLSRVFPVLVVANTGSCVDPQNKIGHPAGCKFPC